MTVKLGGITLSDNLVLRGLDADRVGVDVQRSDEGVAQILVGAIEGGRVLELYGSYSIEQEDQLLALSAAGVPVLLEHPRFTGSVLITGSDLEDEYEYVNPDPEDERVGPFYLLEA